jgi:predicted PurR-regulated permease PerM
MSAEPDPPNSEDAPEPRFRLPTAAGMPTWYPQAVALAIVGILAALALLWFMNIISWVLYILLLSLFASFALEPPVNWFVARGWRRGTATGAVLVLLLIAAAGTVLLIMPQVITELISFFGALPEYVERTAHALGIEMDIASLTSASDSTKATLVNFGGHLLTGVVQATAALFSVIGQLFTVGLIAFYLVAEGPRFQREVLRVWEISIEKMGGYLYSRVILATASAVGVYIVLRILGLPYASSLAIWQGVISAFVPIIGTYIALALPLLIAIVAGTRSDAIVLIVYEVSYQQFENYILSPKVSAKRMQLHPAVAFVFALIGGAVGGLLGAFLALPIGAILQAVASSIVRRHEVVEDQLTRDVSPADVRKARREDPTQPISARVKRWVGSLGGGEEEPQPQAEPSLEREP